MKKIAVAIALACAAGFAVVFFPAGLEADNDHFEPLSRSDFGLLREQAIAAGEPLRPLGITVSAGDSGSQSVQFECRGVPELVLINDERAFSILTSAGAARRAPGVIGFRDRLLPRLRRLAGQPVKPPASQPGAFEAFVLRQRDGIDLRADCSK
ncbi:hypothetical protein [Lysobacter enzymogenes]|uniref:hypothetical protein n=1 Tax=Lysobacter enzymogenes TaxID=69 RepID=UPI001AF3B922|nr:hypothetical protein [Lysobacter enzymogenes]QQQ02397.1 hypothetical protein JHW41_05245 [Lysobacter enzymogenes]